MRRVKNAESFSTDENCRENHLMCDDCMAVCLDCNLDANAGGDICKFCSGESIERYDEIGLDAEEGDNPDWDGDPDDFDEQAAWESIFENWMDEWISGDASEDSIYTIYAAKNGIGWDEVDAEDAETWYYGLTPVEREAEIFTTTDATPSGLLMRPSIDNAITNIIEDIMSSWDDQFMSEGTGDPYELSPQEAIKICEAGGCVYIKDWTDHPYDYDSFDYPTEDPDDIRTWIEEGLFDVSKDPDRSNPLYPVIILSDPRPMEESERFAAENESHWKTFGRVDYNWATDPDDIPLTDEEFWEIDEHIRNEIRYEIDTNNLPGESEVSSWTLSITPDEGEEFIIYYYWGPAQVTGVNS